MRRRLWMLFHLGTLAVLALLTIANVVTMRRPFPTATGHVNPTSAFGPLALNDPAATARAAAGRSPASDDSEIFGEARNPLKIAQVGCEPALRLRVFETVRQVRLQFETCEENSKDQVTGSFNSTNGFEATIFGGVVASTVNEPAAGVFSAPAEATESLAKKGKREVASERSTKSPTTSTRISTDYISLAPGVNQIKIQRAGREQTLRIERK